MSKLLNDLLNEIEPHENVADSVQALCNAIADRIEASQGNRVKLSDLASILREDPAAVADATLTNTIEAHAAKVRTTSRATYDAPSSAFERPRQDVRQGMVSDDDKRDQVAPENENTEPERQRIRDEQLAKERGELLVRAPEPIETEHREPA